jgi:hypothetical protein
MAQSIDRPDCDDLLQLRDYRARWNEVMRGFDTPQFLPVKAALPPWRAPLVPTSFDEQMAAVSGWGFRKLLRALDKE